MKKINYLETVGKKTRPIIIYKFLKGSTGGKITNKERKELWIIRKEIVKWVKKQDKIIEQGWKRLE